MLIPPTAKASAIASYMRVVIIFHFIYSILNFLTQNWLQGIFDLLGAMLGLLAVRSKEGYAYQQVLCYCMFCGIRFVITIIITAIAFSQRDLGTDTMAAWQFWLFVGQAVMAPFVFASGACLAWLLFQELKKVIEEMAANPSGDDSGGGFNSGFYSGGQPASSNPSSSYQAPLLGGAGAPPSSSASGGGSALSPAVVEPPSGFRPFAGQGHRLGGS